jgi:molybdate transport system substrate-binding protein
VISLERLFLLILLITGAGGPLHADEVLVGAAASLTHALDEARTRFEADSGHTVKLSFGSSGTFARQLLHGAPFEIFLSADEMYVEELVRHSLTEGSGDVYAIGRLVLFKPTNTNIPLDARLTGLASVVTEGVFHRLAIASPEHAPYGVAAQTALQSAGLWQLLHRKLVVGANAAQAAQFAVSGSVDAALIPHSLALTPAISQRGSFELVADTLYTPLVHRMVLLRHARAAAREFYDYLRSAEVQQILQQYGFSLDETTTREP